MAPQAQEEQVVVRRRWGSGALCLVTTLTMTVLFSEGVGSTTSAAAEVADDRPNVVLITTDDQTLQDMHWMPRTRRLLGGTGVTFTNGISPHPLCCPARAEVLTGQYAQNNGVRANSGAHGGFDSLDHPGNTVGSWLRDSGYQTGLIGKFLNLYYLRHGRQAGWDHWNPLVGNTVYRPYDYMFFGDGTGDPGDGQLHVTDAVRDRTVDLVEQWAGQDEPFFIWSSFVAPHGTCSEEKPDCSAPPVPPQRYAQAYPGSVLPSLTKPSFNERDMRDKPGWMRRLAPQSPAKMQELFQERIRSLAAVDEAVVKIVETLAEQGELENTYLIFTSDNGYLLGEHRLEEKIFAFQESVRVPFLVSGPGLPAGVRRQQVVSTIDLAPTIAAIAGARPARTVDGLDLRPYAAGNRKLRRTSLIQAGPRGSIGTKDWTYRGAYTPRYTYVRWNRTRFLELYDRQLDPYELRNVAKVPRYRDVLVELRRRTAALGGCAGKACSRDFGRIPPPR
jgi:N-acetylglucosamine-6-sulfatase